MSTSRPNQHPNREGCLNEVVSRLRPAFAQLGAPLPDRLRIAIGFPSTGRRAKATGECWDSTVSADGTFEILIRPGLAKADAAHALPVAAALARELVHAAVGIPAGKGPLYRKGRSRHRPDHHNGHGRPHDSIPPDPQHRPSRHMGCLSAQRWQRRQR
jgi:hypothetical protein